ncbi:TIM barrel protein [Micromonospora inyonensis]|uniref:TIM barrel protein n=1 Tax=Micromonospora inyonensis TaxID=47866 RepID=UPI00159F15A3|nr:TIM barrel protein [Micromonospora inyonensis]
MTRLVRAAGSRVALLNSDAGDLAAGERGYGNDPRLTVRWRQRLREAVQLAVDVDCPLVNVLAGIQLPGFGVEEQHDCLVDNLRWAADVAGAAGRRLVVEPINDHDIPGYLLPRVADVLALIDRLGHDHVLLQLDTYHVSRT